MLDVYATFAEKCMAMPVIRGREERQRALPRRGRHLRHRGDDAGPQGAAGRHVALPRAELRARRATSSSTTKNGAREFAWTTSWGVSTRLDRRPDHDALRRRRAWSCRRGSRRRTWSSCRSSAATTTQAARARLRATSIAAELRALKLRRPRRAGRGRRPRRPRRRKAVGVGEEGRAAAARDRPARRRQQRRHDASPRPRDVREDTGSCRGRLRRDDPAPR